MDTHQAGPHRREEGPPTRGPPRAPPPARMPPSPAPRLTHFLCIPLVTPASRPQLQASLQRFRREVARATAQNPSGIPERAVRPAGTLHLTLGVMSLMTPARVEAAVTLLRRSLDVRGQMPSSGGGGQHQGAGWQSSGPAPLTVSLRGLESMHSPASTTVLFAAPEDEDGALYDFCLRLQRAFREAGLMVSDSRPLLLHATVLNTVYVPGRGSGRGRGRAPRLTVNATEMLHQYRDFEWMSEVAIEKVAICRMGAVAVGGGDEEYVVEGEVRLR